MPAIAAGALGRKLRSHPWSGNIRKLENVIHHGLLICRNQVLCGNDLYLSNLHLGRRSPTAESNTVLDAANQLELALMALFCRFFKHLSS